MRSKESILQEHCVNWFRLAYAPYRKLLFAIPNGGSRNKIEAANLKREGVMPGVADLFFMHSVGVYHGLWIEMKYGNNTQTDNQIDFETAAVKEGYKCVVCWTFDEFRDEIIKYLTV